MEKFVLVAGAGRSGISAARLLASINVDVAMADDADYTKVKNQINRLGGIPQDVALYTNGIVKELIDDCEMVVLSPGISLAHESIIYARSKNIPIISEIDLASGFITNCKFAGVTGTNGKSTVTTMLGDMAKCFEPSTFVGGNLGVPLCDAVIEGLEPKIAILELSSFQLETLNQLLLDVAIITNLAPDHLDRYGSLFDYAKAKAAIFTRLKPGGITILNGNDNYIKEYIEPYAPKQNRSDFSVNPRDSILDINFKAATAGALALQISQECIDTAIRNFKPLPHRMEFVGEIDGVQWINDSKGTNVHAATCAVKGFSGGVHLIVGGLAKEDDFTDLTQSCRERVTAVYCIGKDAQKLANAFGSDFKVVISGTLEQAVNDAIGNAIHGETILLSPACTSYDQFKNYADRGEQFKELFHLSCQRLASSSPGTKK